MNIKIKYFEGATKLQKIDKGSWIDVYAREDVFIPLHLDSKVPLGFAMELPENYEALLNVRSSTSDKWGVILLNELGVIDTSFNGDSDEWRMSFRCIKATCEQECTWNGKSIMIPGTLIKAGDKIGQFRIQECMPVINFVEVDHLGNPSRGGFGSTGPRKNSISESSSFGKPKKKTTTAIERPSTEGHKSRAGRMPSLEDFE